MERQYESWSIKQYPLLLFPGGKKKKKSETVVWYYCLASDVCMLCQQQQTFPHTHTQSLLREDDVYVVKPLLANMTLNNNKKERKG